MLVPKVYILYLLKEHCPSDSFVMWECIVTYSITDQTFTLQILIEEEKHKFKNNLLIKSCYQWDIFIVGMRNWQ